MMIDTSSKIPIMFSSFLLLIMYFLSGISKYRHFSSTVSSYKQKVEVFKLFGKIKLPMLFFNLSIIVVILLEIIMPVIVMYSLYFGTLNKEAFYLTLALAIFNILATILYHYPPVGSEYYAFMKNVSSLGGILLLSTFFYI